MRHRWLLLALLLCTGPVQAAPPGADLHELEWFVHVDLIDPGAGRDLAFYQDLIDASMREATALIEGHHGPVDTPCCARLDRSFPVATFGSSGDGLDVLDSAAEYDVIESTGLPGSQAFLVDSLTYCGGSTPGAIGCARRPPCDGNANDDPDLWLVVSMDAYDGDNLVHTLAHERGHNACLQHVDDFECQLMRPSAGGGCLDAPECSSFQAGRNSSGGSCSCHDVSLGTIADGLSCAEVPGGICSGAVCAEPDGPGGTLLLASGGPGHGAGEIPDDALMMSGLTGGWSDFGPFGTGSDVVEGLAYATDRNTLYGVVPGSGDDRVVTIDPATGEITATLGTIGNGSDRLVALAYDPGATSAPGDDRLLALETDGSFEELFAIDPDAPSSPSLIGPLSSGAPDGFRGLAYDSDNGRLYASSPFPDGLYEVQTSGCNPFCSVTRQVGAGLPRFDAALSYSPDTGMLHLVGTQSGAPPLGPRTLYDVVDPVSLATLSERVQVDAYTPGGLAAVPLPEPGAGSALLCGAALTAGLARRRVRRAGPRWPTAQS